MTPPPILRPVRCASLVVLLTAALVPPLLVACQQDVDTRLEEIRALQEVGDHEASIERLREILASDPSHAEANLRLGVSLVATGRSAAAVWPLRKASQDDEFGIEAGVMLLWTLLEAKDYKEAIRTADALLERDPDNASVRQLRARAAISGELPEQALDDADRLLAKDSEDYAAHVLRLAALLDLERVDEAEAEHQKLIELARESGDEDLAARNCVGRARFLASVERPDESTAAYRDCLERYPAHPLVTEWAVEHYRYANRLDDAVAVRRAAVDAQPDDPGQRFALAELLRVVERPEEYAAVLEETAELFDSPQAWQKLAGLREQQGRWQDAQAALERALELDGRKTPGLLFDFADVLVAQGNLEQGKALAAELEPSYREPILGRIALEEGRYDDALAHFAKGLEMWPNNPVARIFAGRAAEAKGDLPRALEEFREAARIDEGKTEASLAAARLHLLNGEPGMAIRYIQQHMENHADPDGVARVLLIRAAEARGDQDGEAAKLLEQLATSGDAPPRVVAEKARRIAAKDGSVAAAAYLAESPLDLRDPANADAIGLWAQGEIAAGRAEALLKHLSEAATAHPESPVFDGLRGGVLLDIGRAEAAEQAFAAALAKDPDYALAWMGRGEAAARNGRMEEALAHFDRAAVKSADAAFRAAQIARQLGRSGEVEARLERALALDLSHVQAANGLAWILAEERRDLERAAVLAERAVLLNPDASTLDTLGWVRFQQGNATAAVEAYEKAWTDRQTPSVGYRFALALEAAGQADRARTLLRDVLDGESFPEAPEARAILARLDSGQTEVSR